MMEKIFKWKFQDFCYSIAVLIMTNLDFLITCEAAGPAENSVLYVTNIFQWKLVSRLMTAVISIGLNLTYPSLGAKCIMLSKVPQSQQLKITLGPPCLRKKSKKISGDKYNFCVYKS